MGFRKKVQSTDEVVDVVKKSGKKKSVVVGVVILLIIGAFIGKALIGGNKVQGYKAVLNNIVYAELGTFKYEFNVMTSEKGQAVEEIASETSVSDMKDVASSDEQDTSKTPNTRVNTEWGNSEGIKSDEWEFPNYKVTLSGCVSKLEPYTASIDISLATEHFNDRLTSVIIFDGNYYIDIEQMHYWLKNSKDAYLVSVGANLPEGIKYLVIPEAEFQIPSRYAELTEVDISKYNGLRTGLNRATVLTAYVDGLLLGDVFNTKDMNFTYSSETDLLGAIPRNIEKIYKGYLRNAKTKNLYTDEQYTQALRETDNIVNAFSDALLYASTRDLSKGFQLSGSAREYDNAKGNKTYEASLAGVFGSDTKDYKIVANLFRSADIKEVTLPTGSTVTADRLTDKNLIMNTVNQLADYLNFTCIPLENRLELNPTYISKEVKRMLIDLVNNTTTAETYLTERSVNDYIEKYANYKVNEKSTQAEAVNAQIVLDFMQTINTVTGGAVIEKEVIVEEEISKYTELVYEDNQFKITGRITEDSTDNQLSHIRALVLNNTSEVLVLDLTNFSLQTLLSSVYPSNNITLLRNYNNAWDEAMSPSEIELGVSGYAYIDLYFVTSGDVGYMDMWYGEQKLGEVVAY